MCTRDEIGDEIAINRTQEKFVVHELARDRMVLISRGEVGDLQLYKQECRDQ